MRAKLIYTLRALAMMAIMFVTSCSKGGEETTTKPPTKEQTYTITFNANEGEGSMTAQKVEAKKSTALTTNSFTRTDYSFSGWNSEADGSGTSYADGAKVSLSANLTLYAQWIADAATTVNVESVSLNKPTLSLVEGKTATLTATVNPTNATNKDVSWKSSNTAAATVADGVVTAKAAGSATITVTTVDGSKTATCKVTVTAKTTEAGGDSDGNGLDDFTNVQL